MTPEALATHAANADLWHTDALTGDSEAVDALHTLVCDLLAHIERNTP